MQDRYRTIRFHRGRLPHWEVVDGRYFVTVHVAGSIPLEAAARLRQMTSEAAAAPKNEQLGRHRRVFALMEKWLHDAKAEALLTDPKVARMVMEAVHYRQHEGIWNVSDYVVMPNHIHLFLQVERDSLYDTMISFKRWTGRQAKRILARRRRCFWQEEWFDHWSRSRMEDERIAEYIRNNPVKARLVKDYRDWPYASWASE